MARRCNYYGDVVVYYYHNLGAYCCAIVKPTSRSPIGKSRGLGASRPHPSNILVIRIADVIDSESILGRVINPYGGAGSTGNEDRGQFVIDS